VSYRSRAIIEGLIWFLENVTNEGCFNMQASTRLKYITVLIISIIITAAGVFWATQRIDTHRQWASMMRETQRFQSHIQTVAYILNTTFQTNNTAQRWLQSELFYSHTSLYELRHLDEAHWLQLSQIDDMVETVNSYKIFSLNFSSHQSTLVKNIHDVGEKVVSAYWNVFNNTSVDNIKGPPFWYTGSSPPDETILREATQLASNVTKMLPP